jgi:hypothetical protein
MNRREILKSFLVAPVAAALTPEQAKKTEKRLNVSEMTVYEIVDCGGLSVGYTTTGTTTNATVWYLDGGTNIKWPE